jgi:DNA-binding XRE family transcriptional regulator
MSLQVISQNGQPEWAVLPYRDYLELVEQAEMLDDVQAYDKAMESIKNGDDEFIPFEMAVALAEGENKVKIWRDYRGLSRQDLAETIGISVPFLSLIESGKRKASIDVLTKMANALSVNIDDLVVK